MKKILSKTTLALSMSVLIGTSCFTTPATAITTSSSKAAIINTQRTDKTEITIEGLNKLTKKYNIKILSPDEIKSLKLDQVNCDSLLLPTSMEEVEQTIITARKQKDVIIQDEVTAPIDITQNSRVSTNSLNLTASYGSTTYSATQTFSKTSSHFDNLNITTSVAGSYEYTITTEPGSSTISNKHFISCDDGQVTSSAIDINSMSPVMYAINSVNSSTCKITSATSLQHSYSYVVGTYYCIGVPRTPFSYWAHIESNTITGFANHSI